MSAAMSTSITAGIQSDVNPNVSRITPASSRSRPQRIGPRPRPSLELLFAQLSGWREGIVARQFDNEDDDNAPWYPCGEF